MCWQCTKNNHTHFLFLTVNLESCTGQILPQVFENLNAKNKESYSSFSKMLQPPTQPDNSVIALVVVVTPSSLSRLLVILCQDFLGNFGVQGWFDIAFPFYLLIFVRSLFLVFSSTSLRHLFLSFTISFNFSKPKPIFSFMKEKWQRNKQGLGKVKEQETRLQT